MTLSVKPARRRTTSALCAGVATLLAMQAAAMQADMQAAWAQSDGESATDCIERSPRPAYGGTFYDNDFSYLEDPCLPADDSRDALARQTDRAKRIDLGAGVLASFGGESRLKYHDENNHAKSRLDGRDNSFLLNRLRLYGDLEIGQHLRVFGEMVDARSFGEEFSPRGTEEVHWDLLNGFGEIRGAVQDVDLQLRGGRQELLFGAQRLISPLDWGNTRRSFDGGRAGLTVGQLDVSAWFVFPRTIEPDATSDRDEDTTFAGAYATYRFQPDLLLDLYALHLDREDENAGERETWTVGARHAGREGQVFWELEGAYQFGDQKSPGTGPELDVSAGMFTVGVGYDFAELLPWKPRLSLYYDVATGDDDPNDDEVNTFDQLFPLAHAYFGFIDLVGRRNIEAVSLRLSLQPHRRLRLSLAGHHFALKSEEDALYNAGGAAIRSDPTGRSGSEVGQELDVTATVSLLDRVGLQFGYSHFWGGEFVDNTGAAGVSGDASFFYTQLTARF